MGGGGKHFGMPANAPFHCGPPPQSMPSKVVGVDPYERVRVCQCALSCHFSPFIW